MTAFIGGTHGGPSWENFSGTLTMDATTDFVAFRCYMEDNTAIAKCEFNISAINGSPGNLEAVLTTNVAGFPNGSTDIGGGSPTLVSTAFGSLSTGINKLTFTNAYAPTAGDLLWLVLYPNSGDTFNGSNNYVIHQRAKFVHAYGDNMSASSTDTGSTWTGRYTSYGCASLLDTSDVYLPQPNMAAYVSAGIETWDNLDSPDERGIAFELAANMTAKIRGCGFYYSPINTSADFNLGIYKDNALQGSVRNFDAGNYDSAAATRSVNMRYLDEPEIAGAAIGRIALEPADGTNRISQLVMDYGTQGRRESNLSVRDVWYTSRHQAANFSDDKTKVPSIQPQVELIATAGGAPFFIRGSNSLLTR